MLYVTTREKQDTYTALRTLTQNRAPDGGLYLPFRLLPFTPEELAHLAARGTAECMAAVLRRFFPARLTGWDVEATIGRTILKTQRMSHRILLAQTYHNSDNDFSWMVRALSARILGREDMLPEASEWAAIAVRVAVLFGIYGALGGPGLWDSAHPMDMATAADNDFSAPISAWYAKQMGLPIGKILCAGSGTGAMWDLMRNGTFRLETGRGAGEMGGMPESLERLLCMEFGWDTAARYRQVCGGSGTFRLKENQSLREEFYPAVVSRERVQSIIPNVMRTAGCHLDAAAALAYGGMQDYRSATGQIQQTLILVEQGPDFQQGG